MYLLIITDAPSAGSRRWYNNRTVLIGIVVFAVLSTVTAAVVALLCLLSRSTVLKVHYGSYNSLGLSDDLLLPTSERKPPQIHRESITIQLLLTAAFHRIEKMIKYVMQLFMTSKEGLHNHSASISVIQQLRHQNLLLIKRCSRTHDHISLEYESVPNGRLSDHLVNPERLLTWPMRYVLTYLAISSDNTYVCQTNNTLLVPIYKSFWLFLYPSVLLSI